MSPTCKALLTADEAARLTLGVNVIVRPGDRVPVHKDVTADYSLPIAPQGWVALTGPCPQERPCRVCGALGNNPDCRDGRYRVLSRRYGVGQTTIRRIKKGETWGRA